MDSLTKDEKTKVLIEQNIRLVYAAAKRFSFADRDEIVQSGCLGLAEAAKRFDDTRGIAFSTYAVPYILGEMKAFLRRDHAVHIPRPLQDLGAKARRESDRLSAVLAREPTVLEIARSLGVSSEDIAASLEARIPTISLDASASNEDDDTPLHGLIADETSALPLERVLIRDLVQGLDERERKLIRLRYFDGRSQSETAKILGVGQPQVCRLEKALLMKLRKLAG
ncbi:MAG: sigma-70 family RNA polymerase sigma factor [Oscillospiraceae bacterium]|jgi:RNA polymerase sporulation-specific sigma factor|nr:sigma-70 family RNA polymerase sigma factor [Oscillospiraceae bacterium]